MVTSRRGFVLLEFMAALLCLAILSFSAAAVIRAQAVTVRLRYEEQVAREAAAAQMELLEARGFRGGPAEVDLPGWENLASAACAWEAEPARDGVRRVRVVVTWTDFTGVPRRIGMGTRVMP